MTAIEFYTKPENGIIRIPKQFQESVKDTVKVIMLIEEKDKTAQRDKFFDAIRNLNISVPSSFKWNREELYEQ